MKKKHIINICISASLVLILVLVIIFAGGVTPANAKWILAEEEYIDVPEFALNKDVVYHRDMGNDTTVDYYLVQENSTYELYINTERLDVVLVHKQSGEVWSSNPTDAVLASSPGKALEMKSQLQLTVLDKTTEGQSIMNSFTNCVNNYPEEVTSTSILPYYLTYNDEGGLRVKYIIGDFKPDYIIPAIITPEVYEQLYAILENKEYTQEGGLLAGMNPFFLEGRYPKLTKKRLNDPKITKEERKAWYLDMAPGLADLGDDEVVYALGDLLVFSNPKLGKQFQAMFALWFELYGSDSGYASMEELRKAWDDKYSVSARTSNVFVVPLDYILEEDGLKAYINRDKIVFNESKYEISELNVLKYFGAADTSESGYMVIPDGSGALINFNNGKVSISSEVKVQLYGIDRGKDYSKQTEFAQQGYLPVWGIKKQTSSLFAIIEEGDNAATLISDIPRTTKNTVNYTHSSYRLIEYDDMSLFGASSTLRTYQQERYSGDIAIKYTILPGDVDYSDMATYYRQYLIANGLMKGEQITQDNINFNLELIGSMSDTTALMGIQYDYLSSLTTYKQAQEILSQLIDGGVKDINVRYLGWSNNGLMNQVYDKVRPLGELGGWSDYRELEKYAAENNISLFPEAEVVLVYEDKLFDNFMQYMDASRMLSRSNATYYQYNIMQPSLYVRSAFIMRPTKVKSVSESLLKNLQKNEMSGVSLGSLGNMLTGDYHVGDIYDRDKVQEVYTDIYKQYKDAGISVASVGGNMYTLVGTDVLFQLTNESSSHYMADATIPFYQMVLHGYVEYSGESINQSGEVAKSLLKAVEAGAGLSYRWMYASNQVMNDVYFEDMYSSHYSAWLDTAVEFYNRYNSELGHTASQTIVKHAVLSDTLSMTQYSDGTKVYVNYDEVAVSIDGVGVIPALDYLVIKGVK